MSDADMVSSIHHLRHHSNSSHGSNELELYDYTKFHDHSVPPLVLVLYPDDQFYPELQPYLENQHYLEQTYSGEQFQDPLQEANIQFCGGLNMANNSFPGEGRGRGNRQFSAIPPYIPSSIFANMQTQLDPSQNSQSGDAPKMDQSPLSDLHQTQSTPEPDIPAYTAQDDPPAAEAPPLEENINPGTAPPYRPQNRFFSGRGQGRPAGNSQYSAPPFMAQNRFPTRQFRGPSNTQFSGTSYRGQSYPRNQTYQARPEVAGFPDMTNYDPRYDTVLSPSWAMNNRGVGTQVEGFSPKTEELPSPDSSTPEMSRNPIPTRPGMNRRFIPIRPRINGAGYSRPGINAGGALIKPFIGQNMGPRNQQWRQELNQQFRGQPYQLPWQRNQNSSTGSQANNSNSCLIVIPRRPEPHPPRWRWEDAAPVSAPQVEEPASQVEGLAMPEEEDSDDDEEEEKFRRNLSAAETYVLASGISRSPHHPAFIAHCPHIFEGRCKAASKRNKCCRDKIHFKRIMHAHTDIRLGDCSFLDSCDLSERCPYIHYKPLFSKDLRKHIEGLNKARKDWDQGKGLEVKIQKNDGEEGKGKEEAGTGPANVKNSIQFPPSIHSPPEWIRCDITRFDMKIIGKFGVIMADPPWDIRMALPYGTVPDQAIINLPLGQLQDQGLFFLWCTARTVDAGHACLRAWGYEYCDEIAWVKVDHLDRLISVGRTGHWLNHTMEHCIVGIKGNPTWVNKGCDMDVIVAQPRATSHKPDEIYDMIDRLVGPNIRKLELFGREHNIRRGWFTLGNQLPPSYIHNETIKSAFVESIANTTQTYTYNPNWNPWTNGFDRYGYGESKNWREERKINAARSRSFNRGRGGRGSIYSMYPPRPGFRENFQGVGRGQQWTGYNNKYWGGYAQKNQQSFQRKDPQKAWPGNQQDNQQGQPSSQKDSHQANQQGNQQGKAGGNTDIRDHASYSYPPPHPTDGGLSFPRGLANLLIDNENSKGAQSDNSNSHQLTWRPTMEEHSPEEKAGQN